MKKRSKLIIFLFVSLFLGCAKTPEIPSQNTTDIPITIIPESQKEVTENKKTYITTIPPKPFQELKFEDSNILSIPAVTIKELLDNINKVETYSMTIDYVNGELIYDCGITSTHSHTVNCCVTTCGKNHIHTIKCAKLICEKPTHVHSSSCYKNCSKYHSHTESKCTWGYICDEQGGELLEHTHSAEIMIDPENGTIYTPCYKVYASCKGHCSGHKTIKQNIECVMDIDNIVKYDNLVFTPEAFTYGDYIWQWSGTAEIAIDDFKAKVKNYWNSTLGNYNHMLDLDDFAETYIYDTKYGTSFNEAKMFRDYTNATVEAKLKNNPNVK